MVLKKGNYAKDSPYARVGRIGRAKKNETKVMRLCGMLVLVAKERVDTAAATVLWCRCLKNEKKKN